MRWWHAALGLMIVGCVLLTAFYVGATYGIRNAPPRDCAPCEGGAVKVEFPGGYGRGGDAEPGEGQEWFSLTLPAQASKPEQVDSLFSFTCDSGMDCRTSPYMKDEAEAYCLVRPDGTARIMGAEYVPARDVHPDSAALKVCESQFRRLEALALKALAACTSTPMRGSPQSRGAPVATAGKGSAAIEQPSGDKSSAPTFKEGE